MITIIILLLLLIHLCDRLRNMNIKSIEKILELIENGDPISILAEDALIENFNELLKLGLIDIVDDKLILTAKGKEARILGLNQVLHPLLPNDQKPETISPHKQKKVFTFLQWCLSLSLTLLGLFIAAIMTDCSVPG